MAQTRTIEKYGVLILSEEERESFWLAVFCSVIQKPLQQEYTNPKTLPPRGWYGYCSIVSQGYVCDRIAIEYYNQRVWFGERYHAQEFEVITSAFAKQNEYLASISLRVNVPVAIVFVPNTPLNYPRLYPTEFRFKVPDGVVLQVNVLNQKFTKTVESQTNPVNPFPPVPPSDGDPPSPPKPGEPPSTGVPGSGAPIEISPPYNPSDNDDGNTYVPAPTQPSDYTQSGVMYNVLIEKIINDGGVPQPATYEWYNGYAGKIGGLTTLQPSNSDAEYGFTYADGTQFRGLIKNYQRYGYQGRTNGFLVKIKSIVKI